MSWLRELLIKGIRESFPVVAVAVAAPSLFFGGLYIYFVLHGDIPPEQTVEVFIFAAYLYWLTMALVLILGSGFLAEENAARTTNFLLRLSLTRGQIFGAKTAGHLLLLAASLLATLVIILFSLPVIADTIQWQMPGPWKALDLYTAAVWIPIAYFIAVGFSIVLDSGITAFMGAMIVSFFLHVLTSWAGNALTRTMSEAWFGPRPGQFLGNLFLTCLVPIPALLAWWLFSRKEGR